MDPGRRWTQANGASKKVSALNVYLGLLVGLNEGFSCVDLAIPGPLFADDAGDPELSGLHHVLLFKKLPRPPRKRKGAALFQTTGLLERGIAPAVSPRRHR
jgi:hypothetical protein